MGALQMIPVQTSSLYVTKNTNDYIQASFILKNGPRALTPYSIIDPYPNIILRDVVHGSNTKVAKVTPQSSYVQKVNRSN